MDKAESSKFDTRQRDDTQPSVATFERAKYSGGILAFHRVELEIYKYDDSRKAIQHRPLT